jgi:hypothetical protein
MALPQIGDFIIVDNVRSGRRQRAIVVRFDVLPGSLPGSSPRAWMDVAIDPEDDEQEN